MRRRALLAASAKAGSNGGELPTIPDGFFPLYLTHDYILNEHHKDTFVINPTETTITLYDIIYRYAKVVTEFNGDGYGFYPEDYDINIYIDGYKVTNFYVYDDGYSEVFTNNMYFAGEFFDTGKITYGFLR